MLDAAKVDFMSDQAVLHHEPSSLNLVRLDSRYTRATSWRSPGQAPGSVLLRPQSPFLLPKIHQSTFPFSTP